MMYKNVGLLRALAAQPFDVVCARLDMILVLAVPADEASM